MGVIYINILQSLGYSRPRRCRSRVQSQILALIQLLLPPMDENFYENLAAIKNERSMDGQTKSKLIT